MGLYDKTKTKLTSENDPQPNVMYRKININSNWEQKATSI